MVALPGTIAIVTTDEPKPEQSAEMLSAVGANQDETSVVSRFDHFCPRLIVRVRGPDAQPEFAVDLALGPRFKSSRFYRKKAHNAEILSRLRRIWVENCSPTYRKSHSERFGW